jgi:hypothetical protein
MVGADGMATAKGCWCGEGSVADGTFEELYELVHGRADILTRSAYK